MPKINFIARGGAGASIGRGHSVMAIYRFLMIFLKTLAIVLKPALPASAQRWISLRSALQSATYQKLNLHQTIWVHASSGEIEYAKTVIRQLKNEAPDQSIVVTYSSDSAEKLFENIRAFVDVFAPLPWDDVYSMRLLIKKLNPRLLMIARTDLWPEMITQCKREKIPMMLIAYRPHLTWANRFYLKGLLSSFRLISCADVDTQTKMEQLFQNTDLKPIVRADGDTRFDQVFARLSQPSKLFIHSTQRVFTFGSLWPEDEKNVHSLWDHVLQNGQRLILCPHDVSEVNIVRLTKNLDEKNYVYRKLSQLGEEITFNFPILVIDQIGFLADAYRFTDFAFVGGSFKSRVHSVMEPLACGVPVLVGPFIQNSPEALRYAALRDFVLVAAGPKSLISHYEHLLQTNLTALKKTIESELRKNQGASPTIVRFIFDNFLKKADS